MLFLWVILSFVHISLTGCIPELTIELEYLLQGSTWLLARLSEIIRICSHRCLPSFKPSLDNSIMRAWKKWVLHVDGAVILDWCDDSNCTRYDWGFYESFHRASENIVGNLCETFTGLPDLSVCLDRSTWCKHVSFFLYGFQQWRVHELESSTPRKSIKLWYFPDISWGNGSTHFVLCILQVNRIMAPLLFIGYIIIVFFLMLNMWVTHAHLDRAHDCVRSPSPSY